MDVLTPEQRKKNMQSIKGKNTGIEVVFSKALREKGYFFRRNNKAVFGRPDFSLKKKKIAIFCDSEFWHGKNFSEIETRIGTNRDYWIKKIQGNIERDKKVNQRLAEDGWIVIRFWEKEIKKDVVNCMQIVEETFKKRC